jgi:NDP-sugar pyrophosphorylase family protein
MPENNEKSFIFHEKSFLSSYEKVLDRIQKIKFKNFYLYKGKFNEQKKKIFNNLKDRKISITNIDCDLYSSTVDSFNIIENFLQIGSIILLDDYNSFNADNLKGQRKAFNEYKTETKWIIEPFFSYMYVGQSFLVVGNKNL